LPPAPWPNTSLCLPERRLPGSQSKAILEPAAKKLALTLKQDSSLKAYPIIKTQVESGKVT